MAQVITATLRGTVHGADDGAPMAEVEVTLVNEATGDTRTATTNAKGEFAFTNLQVGGPYRVTANFAGFKPSEEKGITLTASRTRDVDLGMRLQEEVIEVSGNAIARNTSNKTVVTAAEIDELPSVNRDPRDVVRRNPEVTVEGGARALSIGGANTRYNSITIDGIREDDDFGLNPSGYPTRRSPIALSAVQELAVDSSPFDVRYGKFLGGNVNIVTKSGTNELKGTVFGTFANDAMLGNHSGNQPVNVDYRDIRYGATVGGPILKDQVYFLASVEGLNSKIPISDGPAGSNASIVTAGVTATDIANAIRIAHDVYGFDAGAVAGSNTEHDLKLLGKLDWIISPKHRATVSYQRTGGNSVQLGNSASNTRLPLSSNWYDAQDTLNTFTGRVTSDWTNQLSTTVEANAKLVSSRVPPLKGLDFMQATITTSPNNIIVLGPDTFRHANLLDNDVFHTKAEANYLIGANLVTAGVEYERTYIDNLFVPNSLGTVSYNNLADFEAKRPFSITYANATTLNPSDAAANWNFGQWTGYVQDQLKLSPELTLTAGLRGEIYQTGSRSTRNQNFVNRYGFANNASLEGRSILAPRVGVSWLPIPNLNVRAGAGLYSGGTPGVWMSNNYTNDGVRTFSVQCAANARPTAACPNPGVIMGFDGRNIPQAMKDSVMTNAGNGNVDALDPNFKLPSVWKAGVGADYTIDIPGAGDYGKNLELRANYTFTKVRNGVTWIDLRRDLASIPNNTPIGRTVDGRPLYSPMFTVARGYDMLLTNDSRGYSNVASGVVQKAFPFGLFVSASYAYTDSHEVNPGTSSISTSNYGITAISDPNHPALAVSNYERRHRVTGVVEYSYALAGKLTDAAPWKDMKTSFGMFIESRSGQPFSWTFSGAAVQGGDNSTATLAKIFGEDGTSGSGPATRPRELFYVPNDANVCETTYVAGCQVILRGITRDQFNTFLNRTGLASYRGKIAPRNGFDGPRYNRIDVRFAQDLPNPIVGQRARVVVDIENFGNLLNSSWGLFRQVQFPFYTPAVDVAVDRTTPNNAYVYSNLRSPNPTQGPQAADILLSVWRLSVGVMYDF